MLAAPDLRPDHGVRRRGTRMASASRSDGQQASNLGAAAGQTRAVSYP
jgi:hypothetical protein